MLFDVTGRNRRRHRNDQGFLAKLRCNRLQNVAYHLRLDTQQNNVRPARRRTIVGGHGGPQLLCQRRGFLLVLYRGGDPLHQKQALLKESSQQNATKLPSTQNR